MSDQDHLDTAKLAFATLLAAIKDAKDAGLDIYFAGEICPDVIQPIGLGKLSKQRLIANRTLE